MTETTANDRDVDGFAPIGCYGVIGDGRGAALIATDGTVDWWASPRLDSAPAFAALLDPALGGRIELAPTDEVVEIRRRYVLHTNLLETTFVTAAGRVRVTDSLNSGQAGALPWSELARRVEGVKGTVTMRLTVVPGTGLGAWSPWIEDDERCPLIHAGELTLGVRCTDRIELRVADDEVGATFDVTAGERLVVAFVASHAEPLYLAGVGAIDDRIDLTIQNWRRWTKQVSWPTPRRDQVVRSALVLKTLMMAETGAIAAAATTSLPERTGGSKNWDYRFAWVRDAAFTIDALASCGLQEEVHAAVSWLLRTIRVDGPAVHVMYDLDGAVPTESDHAAVPGYRFSQPVMVGNDASGQIQLGIYGDLFGTVADWVFGGHVLDVVTARQLADLADQCADVWRNDDAGIWELQATHAYTSSKMNCWRALDAAARMADAGHIAGPAGRWRHEAATIRAWVDEHCWSDHKQAYTFYAGTDDLDASVLLGAKIGFERGERMRSTIAAIQNELSVGPLLYRYSGVDQEEQAFIACSFWWVQALVHVGQVDAAEDLMSKLDAIPNELGLMSEMSTPGSGELVGNIPQALSHLALIGAAATLAAVTDPSERTQS